MKKSYISKSVAQTKKIGEELGKEWRGRAHGSHSPLIGLYGDLGAGKTTFVQGLAKGLGVDSSYYVNSPTFTLMNEYKDAKGTLMLVHMDLYRMDSPQACETLAIEDYLSQDVVIAIEWPERGPLLGRQFRYRVRFEAISPTQRKIEIGTAQV